MEKKLIVVLTVSSQDWHMVPNQYRSSGVVHINCDSGQLSQEPCIGATRVMVIADVRGMDNQGRTDLLCQILDQYPGYDKVVGLHGRIHNFTVNNIDRNRPALSGIPLNDEECTTATFCPYSRLLEALFETKPVLLTKVQEHFDQLFDNIKTDKKKQIKGITILKHRIAHLFLPLDIDFQGLREVTDQQKRREYAKEIIDDYRNRCADYPFLQLLADLHFLVSKANEITLDTGVTVGKSLSDESLPDGKCVKEVLEEAGVAFPSDLKQKLKQICAFKNDWSFDPDAEIAKFLCALDKAVKENSPDDFLKIVDSGVNGFNGQSFHQWLAELDKALDELREALPGEGGVSRGS